MGPEDNDGEELENEDGKENALTNPENESSDPALPIVPFLAKRLIRARRIIRGIRRLRRRRRSRRRSSSGRNRRSHG